MKTTRVIAGLLIAAASWAAPAAAGHTSAAPSDAPDGYDLDVTLKLGADGFRLGGRVFGPEGVWGAWLNGKVHDRGFTLDGRVQDPDKATKFRFDADVLDWLRRGPPGRTL